MHYDESYLTDARKIVPHLTKEAFELILTRHQINDTAHATPDQMEGVLTDLFGMAGLAVDLEVLSPEAVSGMPGEVRAISQAEIQAMFAEATRQQREHGQAVADVVNRVVGETWFKADMALLSQRRLPVGLPGSAVAAQLYDSHEEEAYIGELVYIDPISPTEAILLSIPWNSTSAHLGDKIGLSEYEAETGKQLIGIDHVLRYSGNHTLQIILRLKDLDDPKHFEARTLIEHLRSLIKPLWDCKESFQVKY